MKMACIEKKFNKSRKSFRSTSHNATRDSFSLIAFINLLRACAFLSNSLLRSEMVLPTHLKLRLDGTI